MKKLTTSKVIMLVDIEEYNIKARDMYNAQTLPNGQVIVQKQFGLWVPVEDHQWMNDDLEDVLKANPHLCRTDLM